MPASIFQSSTLPILEQVVGFTEARHSVLAGNIANMDTPGYRVRDLSVETFQNRLKEAITAKQQAAAATSPGEIYDNPDEAMQRVREATKSILYHDGSDVGMEQQVLELSKNQFMHNLAITVMTNQFRLIETAISERV